jgi:hypothetical protein
MPEKESQTRLFFDAAFGTIVINSAVLQSKQNLSSSLQQAVSFDPNAFTTFKPFSIPRPITTILYSIIQITFSLR